MNEGEHVSVDLKLTGIDEIKTVAFDHDELVLGESHSFFVQL